MAYETKLPRPASSSTAEDFSEGSEVFAVLPYPPPHPPAPSHWPTHQFASPPLPSGEELLLALNALPEVRPAEGQGQAGVRWSRVNPDCLVGFGVIWGLPGALLLEWTLPRLRPHCLCPQQAPVAPSSPTSSVTTLHPAALAPRLC